MPDFILQRAERQKIFFFLLFVVQCFLWHNDEAAYKSWMEAFNFEVVAFLEINLKKSVENTFILYNFGKIHVKNALH